MSASVRTMLKRMDRIQEAAEAARAAERAAENARSDDVEMMFLKEYDDVVAVLVGMINAPELGAALAAIAAELGAA